MMIGSDHSGVTSHCQAGKNCPRQPLGASGEAMRIFDNPASETSFIIVDSADVLVSSILLPVQNFKPRINRDPRVLAILGEAMAVRLFMGSHAS
jgi:hypothetical protein